MLNPIASLISKHLLLNFPIDTSLNFLEFNFFLFHHLIHLYCLFYWQIASKCIPSNRYFPKYLLLFLINLIFNFDLNLYIVYLYFHLKIYFKFLSNLQPNFYPKIYLFPLIICILIFTNPK